MFIRCKVIFLILFFIWINSDKKLYAQNIEFSSFYVPEKNNSNIGYLSTSINYPIYKRVDLNIEGGFQLIGSYLGNRGGYFAFGYRTEIDFFSTKRINLGFNTSLLAGGGGSAPDKDGWLVQASTFTQYLLSKRTKLKAGISYTYVSSGMIQGLSPFLGVKYDLFSKGNQFKLYSIYPEFGFGYFNHQKLAFIGAGLNWSSKNIGGDVTIHDLANIYGGYMQALASLGYNFNWSKFNFTPGFVFGFGGGGATDVGGGALCGVQLSSRYISPKINVGVKYQLIKAPLGQFNYSAIFLTLGKTINDSSKLKLNWQPVLKLYNGSNGFGNIGIRFVGFDRSHFSLLGSTYWAFTDNRGGVCRRII